MSRAKTTLIGLVCASSIACATTGPRGSDLSELQDSIEAYNDAYRWKNYERASLFLPPELRGAFLATFEEDDKALHVEDYQILRADLVSKEAARVIVRMRFMLLPSVTLESRNLVQHWHKVAGRWILETEENSIREIDPSLLPQNPNAFGGGAEPAPDGMEIEVTDPEGRVIRKDGDPKPEVEVTEPAPPPS